MNSFGVSLSFSQSEYCFISAVFSAGSPSKGISFGAGQAGAFGAVYRTAVYVFFGLA
jgi:hypothetical protein